MVTFRHFGRMGNFLYEASCAYGYAKKYNLPFSCPNTTKDKFWNPLYLQHLVLPNYNDREDILLNELWNTEQHYNEYPFYENWRDLNIVFNGYNQSFLYWDFCRNDLLNDFKIPYEFNKGVCSIHVRRTDYLLHPTLHPVCTPEYYYAAMDFMYKKLAICHFKVFSDDIKWCKGFFGEGDEDVLIEYSEGKSEMEDLTLMSHCEHQICSNSTMATWGAELNRNPNKIVIVPHEDNWFGIDNQKKMTIKDMYRPEWVRIKY